MDNNIEYIYHYTTLEKAIKFILPEMQLRLGIYKNTNDPRENKEFFFKLVSENGATFPNNNEELSKLVSKEIVDGVKLLSFSTPNANNHGFDYTSMWAHYGDKHNGVCLQIDKKEFEKENPEIFKGLGFNEVNYVEPYSDYEYNKKLEQIDYDKILSIGIKQYVRQNLRFEKLKYLYFTKYKDWEYEREIRLLVFSDVQTDEYCKINNSLRKVYLGEEVNKNYLPSLLHLLPDEILLQPVACRLGRMITNKDLFNEIHLLKQK